MKHLVISFISPDRPGLVDAISNLVNQYQGNWQTSSMHHMSGFFAGVIEIAVSEQQSALLINDLNAIKELDSIIKIASPHSDKQLPSVVLELTANDRAGIVQEISSVIHNQGGNLLKLVSRQESAPHSGQDLFKAKVTVVIDTNNLDELIHAIENQFRHVLHVPPPYA